MKISKLACLVMIALVMTACTKLKSESYYREHLDDAREVMQKCEKKYKDGDVLKGDFKENCSNASKALAADIRNSILNNPSLR